MPKIVIRDVDDTPHEVEAAVGDSVMEVAVREGVRGIVGQCGGSLSCASCHVYVDPEWFARTGDVSEMEDEMLDGALAERAPESRLSCQIRVDEDLAGLSLRVAPEQL